MITVVDYEMGNIKSLANALEALGQKVKLAKTNQEIERAEKLVFPGVGSFGKTMEVLRKKHLDVAITEHIGQKKPFLGICLGVRGLSILQGNIVRFKKGKIPHMGWNQIALQKQSRLFRNIPDKSFVYFMHSFYPKPKDKSLTAADTFYEENFCSSIESGNVFATQFHPEKSGEVGMRILKNFCNLAC